MRGEPRGSRPAALARSLEAQGAFIRTLRKGRQPSLRQLAESAIRAHSGRNLSSAAHASGGWVVLVGPGRCSASDFTICSISRRMSALNGPMSIQ